MRITKLDGLRGIFSLMIVFLHYKKPLLPNYIYDSFIIRESYAFVDFFFVLSGFVIAHNYNSLKSKDEFWKYLKKRFARLYPLLLFTVLINLSFLLFTTYFLPQFRNNIEPLSVHLLKTLDSLTFLNSTPILGDSSGTNPASWSISSEMISYIAFGLFCISIASKNLKIIFSIGLIVISCLFLYHGGEYFSNGKFGFLRGFVGFFSGYIVWELNKLKFKLNNNLEFVIPIILVLILHRLNTIENTSQAGLIFSMISIPLFFSLSILCLLKTNGVLSKLLDLKPIQFLGKISYSVYLNHGILILIFPRVVFKVFKLEETEFNQILILSISIILVLTFSNFTYKYVEQKGGKFLRKQLLRSPSYKLSSQQT